MLNELFSRMMIEPSILMIGNKYKDISTEVMNYSWNAIITTNCELKLSVALANDKRCITDISSKDDMKANIMDHKNLHIIRLFEKECYKDDVDEFDVEDYTDQAVSMLTRISEVIRRNGIILLEDFEEPLFSHKELRRAFRGLGQNQKQLYIFNCQKKDQYLRALEEKKIAVIFEQSINSFFKEFFSEEEYFEEDPDINSVHIYIEADKKAMPVSIDSKKLLETESFATLLNVELLNEVVIPEGMYKDYFYMFLKNSVREPQWYGYKYGFNIHRPYEAYLYKKVKKGLESVGKPTNNLLLVVGQTGTGKSVSLAAVAYKIFQEKKYPVVFINDPDINFYSKNEFKEKKVIKKGSAAFNALDHLLHELENKGAKATLLIWDTSSYSTGRQSIFRLYQALLARGRKVYVIGTAYEINETSMNTNNKDMYDEDSWMNKKFIECKAKVDVESEIEDLQSILVNRCNLTKKNVDAIIKCYAKNSTNFLSLFYQLFDMLRSDLSKGVYREASLNINAIDDIMEKDSEEGIGINNIFAMALKKAEAELVEAGIVESVDVDSIEKNKIEIAKEEFMRCIAVCSQFKNRIPYDFALRILGTYNLKIIRMLSKSTFFILNRDYHDNYEISIRTPLEASMYISAKRMSPRDEVMSIIKMLEYMNPSSGYGQQKEVRLCERMIRIIGPNNNLYKYKYRRTYPDIIKALEDLRENKNIWEPILISQEITYIREYYGRDETLNKDIRIDYLEKAVKIADETLKKIEHYGTSMGTRNAIIVESANSQILLCQLKKSNDALIYKQLRKNLKDVMRYDNMNYHAYVTYLTGSIAEYKNELDKIKKMELLEAMCSIVDEITFENPDISSSSYFKGKVTEIYSLLDDTEIVNKYIEELAENGSSAGIYVIAKKILLENGVDFKKPIKNKLQEDACNKVYELFKQEHYVDIVRASETCQYLLLNIVWLMNNKEPIYGRTECRLTHMREETWRELLDICNNFIINFCNGVDDVYQKGNSIKYLKALCLGQLQQYSDSIAILRSIYEDSSQGSRRVRTMHMLCNSDGTTMKFIGRLDGEYNEIDRTGKIYIEEFGSNPIYYYGPNMKTANLSEGTVFNDIEIGYGYIAPKAFREIEIRE